MTEWQPIDTAPKDKPILGSGNGYVYEMEWSDVEGWNDPAERQMRPEFWMPLPEPPKHFCKSKSGDWICKTDLDKGIILVWSDCRRIWEEAIVCPFCGEKND